MTQDSDRDQTFSAEASEMRRLTEDEADLYSFYGDEDDDGYVVSQHRFYRWGDCIIAIGELNAPNQWDDERFDAQCAELEKRLSSTNTTEHVYLGGAGLTAAECDDALEARAREVLAQTCEVAGLRASARSVREGTRAAVSIEPVLRAMTRFAREVQP